MALGISRSQVVIGLVVLAGGAAAAYFLTRPPALPAGFATGAGRIEATEVDVATKVPGRLLRLQPREGATLRADEVVGELDALDVAAQLRAAEAQVRQAQEAVREAREGVRKGEADQRLAQRTLARSQELVQRGFISKDRLDRDLSAEDGAVAALAAARARVDEADAAQAAAVARADSLRANVGETVLKAPIDGRVLYRLAEPGQVLPAGGKVLTLLDFSDVFLYVFLPANEAGRVVLGSEARIVADAWPDQVIPAHVSFVSPRAQFTPREVETRNEREKLMFRVRLKVDADWLQANVQRITVGTPAVAWFRLDPAQPWPDKLGKR
ncbi:HlyD family secretion protein [Rhodocyclus gracilis]|uniref:HlyD family efflux transporter periplasmic adaptor subunit n=1 Tax=Rhodocyclus tenuis TaxID=1066 RepID=A0A6L5JW12_RHOTE|nr:HlyD family efflux transporter periplasmic adaptor subunit [Rhodocyclus gracilis]MQY50972.1 HlyD family efflux transporter periplasmic adaptor subunit [Rhodocyclus gracilis]